MAVKAKPTNKKSGVLEGFTYEEIPNSTVEVEIPQEVIDNSVVIDVSEVELQNAEEEKILDEAGVKPVKEEKSKKSSEITFELPKLKEPTLTYSKRRNSSRKINLMSYDVDTDSLQLDDSVRIKYKPYADIIKDYIFRGMFLQITYALRDNDALANEEFVEYLKIALPEYLGKLANVVLEAHKSIESITGSVETNLLKKDTDENDQMIEIFLELEIKFPNHTNLYVSKDRIVVPA